MNKVILFFISLFILGSCLKEEDIKSPEEQLMIDIGLIQEYLEDNNLTAQFTASGLHFFFDEEGSGEKPTINSTVTVKYKGYLLNGDVFDETTGNNTATFPVSGVIRGWQEGIPLFKEGGKGTLLIPSALAYGTSGARQIPPNTVLLFDIELIDIE